MQCEVILKDWTYVCCRGFNMTTYEWLTHSLPIPFYSRFICRVISAHKKETTRTCWIVSFISILSAISAYCTHGLSHLLYKLHPIDDVANKRNSNWDIFSILNIFSSGFVLKSFWNVEEKTRFGLTFSLIQTKLITEKKKRKKKPIENSTMNRTMLFFSWFFIVNSW